MRLNFTKFGYLLLIAIVIITGLTSRVTMIFLKPFWVDEAWTLYLSQINSFKQLLTIAPVPGDIHPGIYYALIKLTLYLTHNLYILRFTTSAFPQTLSIILFVLWANKRKLSRLLIIITVILLLWSPFLVYYSWQLRMYSLTMLLTVALGLLTYDYLVTKTGEKTLLLMVPLFVLSEATDVSGYMLMTSIILTVLITDYLKLKSVTKLYGYHRNWILLSLAGTCLAVLPYFPFKFSGQFFRASWLNPPTIIEAIRELPFTTLGLENALNPSVSSGFIDWIIFPMLIMLSLMLFSFWVKRLRRPQYLLTFLMLVFFVPVLIFFFSQTSWLLYKLPGFHRLIPPISAYLPRFFLPQAVFLHFFMAYTVYKIIQQKSHIGIYWFIPLTLIFLWITNYVRISGVPENEELTIKQAGSLTKNLSTGQTVFYPGYTALMLQADQQIPFTVTAKVFSVSNQVEELIKKSTPNTKLICRYLPPETASLFTLIETKKTPAFFGKYKSNLKAVTDALCLTKKTDGLFSYYSCRCPAPPEHQ